MVKLVMSAMIPELRKVTHSKIPETLSDVAFKNSFSKDTGILEYHWCLFSYKKTSDSTRFYSSVQMGIRLELPVIRFLPIPTHDM